MSKSQHLKGFQHLGLPARFVQAVARLGYHTPTPIQQDAIPVALSGRDLVGIAQTGTGKTLAFGLPMLSRLQPGEFGLVLAPTRELAQQIDDSLRRFEVKTALLIGGAPMAKQVGQLRARPTVVVATPGRLLDHLAQKTADLRRVSIVVLDEADRMLDMGFTPAIRKILDATPTSRQTMLFSATMPKEILRMAETDLRKPVHVEVDPAGTVTELVKQELVFVSKDEKGPELARLLKEDNGPVLVFARTRHGARKLAKSLKIQGHSAAEIHSDRTLAQRKAALHGFKNGDYRVLVATDIAARGIDVKNISLVVNYDVPDNPEDYVHRIGRTGRAGARGRAVTLATHEQKGEVRDIEKLLKSELPVSKRTATEKRPVENEPKSFPARQARRNRFQRARKRAVA
ncbi:MAG: DEAD/DEAH box helicase [Armatimonadetes bacterium]|nr:DEAD/DEAH box helicase [Armatimonadota bacterium]